MNFKDLASLGSGNFIAVLAQGRVKGGLRVASVARLSCKFPCKIAIAISFVWKANSHGVRR